MEGSRWALASKAPQAVRWNGRVMTVNRTVQSRHTILVFYIYDGNKNETCTGLREFYRRFKVAQS